MRIGPGLSQTRAKGERFNQLNKLNQNRQLNKYRQTRPSREVDRTNPYADTKYRQTRNTDKHEIQTDRHFRIYISRDETYGTYI